MPTRSRLQWTLAAALMAPSMLGGCAGDVDPSNEQAGEVDEDEQVYQQLEALGHAREDVEMNGEYAVVGGDMAYERAALLAGDYGVDEDEEGDEDVAKGWAFPRTMTSATRKNIKLAFVTGALAPSDTIKAAFRAAAANWSLTKNWQNKATNLKISESNTGSTITVSMVEASLWLQLTPCGTVQARACTLPFRKNAPSTKIYIMTDPNVGCEGGWSETLLANVTRHELGHAVGLAHPGDTTSQLTSGEHASKVAGTCNSFPCNTSNQTNTTSIMTSLSMVRGRCSISPSVLQVDDRNTIVAMYPAP